MHNEFNKLKISGRFRYRKKIENKINKTEFNSKFKEAKESYYLLQYKKYFQKKLVIKYNILPKEYTLIQLENFIRAKYCHSLAKFKEDLLFNYKQEFLKRFYKKKESQNKIPLFSQFYKAYLQFFCSPILSELNLNELIEEMVERKAKVFYQNNYNEEEEKNKESKKFINTIFFTNKVRKDISRRNTLTDLSKTTIEFMTTSNKNSVNSYMSLNNLVNEIGDGKNDYINSNFNIYNKNNINSNAIEKINNNNYLKINKIKKINKFKIKEINSYLNDKDNLSKKRDIFKNSSKNTEVSSINEKNITEIRMKAINNNDINNTSSKNMTSINVDMNSNKNEKSKEKKISKPLYHKINIVNNKIIIINNSRSKGNILKSSKDKIKKRSSQSRNIKNNFLSTYSSNTTGIIESKDQTSNNSNLNTNTYLVKTFKKNIYNKGLSTKNCHSMKTKSDYKIKHIHLIKEKKLNTKIRPSIITNNTICTDNNTRKYNANPLVNYLYNYKNLNDKVCNTTEAKRKKLTNFQRFSNNIKNISQIQRLKNISKDKLSPFNKLASSNCSLGYSINSTNKTQNKNKTKNVLKISTYKALEKLPKIRFSNKIMYRNKFSTQEQFKTNLKINNNNVNKNVLSLNLNKK